MLHVHRTCCTLLLITCKCSFVLRVWATAIVTMFLFMTNQWLQSLGDMQVALCRVFSLPSPAKVKIKALGSSQPEEGSVLAVWKAHLSRRGISHSRARRNLIRTPARSPPATPHTLNRSRQRWLGSLICIQTQCCPSSRSANVKKPEASLLGSSFSTRHPSFLLLHPPPRPGGGLDRGGGYGALFLPMDSFINQKEIAEGWKELGRGGGRERKKEGRLCSRVKRRLSAEGQRRLSRAVTSGWFTVAPSHLPTRDRDPLGADAATAETQSPETSQVLCTWRECQIH